MVEHFANATLRPGCDQPGQHYAAGNIYNALLYKGDIRSIIENAIGGAGNDQLFGNDAANLLRGGTGDDTFRGAGGSDRIEGGAGTDTAIYEGQWTDYQITSFGDGQSLIVDVRSGSPDGIDTLLDVEIFQFADRTIFPFELVETAGATDLVREGARFVLRDSEGLGPSLKYYGGDYLNGQFGDWEPIGAEATAEGYIVAWKFAGADQYTFWNADYSGNYSSQLTEVLSGSDECLPLLEPRFAQDLNGDGVVGWDVASTIESWMLAATDDGAPLRLLGGVGFDAVETSAVLNFTDSVVDTATIALTDFNAITITHDQDSRYLFFKITRCFAWVEIMFDARTGNESRAQITK